jgi:hypothetical protein
MSIRRIFCISTFGIVVLCAVVLGLFKREVSWAETAKSRIANGLSRQMFSVENLERDIVTYDDFGHHRSGEVGDLATTDWLEDRLTALGYAVTRQSFSIPSYVIDEASLIVDNKPIAVFPQFPVTFTPPSGLSGRLHSMAKPPENWAGKIAYVDIPDSVRNGTLERPKLFSAIDSAARSGAMAVIVMVRAKCGTYKALNAPVALPAWPVPVVLVGENDAAALASVVDTGTTVSLSVTGTSKNLEAFNIIAEIGPTESRPVVVSTPQSGWFNAAAERGSGIAAFLALAEWATTVKDQRFMFVANSGHERVNYGAHKFMERFAPRPDETAFWLHIGANVGATRHGSKDPVNSRYMMSNWGDIWKSWALFRNQPGYERKRLEHSFQHRPAISHRGTAKLNRQN